MSAGQKEAKVYKQQAKLAQQLGRDIAKLTPPAKRIKPAQEHPKPQVHPGAKKRTDLPPLTRGQKALEECEPFVLCQRLGLIRKCEGCGAELTAKIGGLILRKQMFREHYRPTQKRWYRSPQLVNAYFDLEMTCVRRKFPRTEKSDIIIHDDLVLEKEHKRTLCNFGIHSACTHHKKA